MNKKDAVKQPVSAVIVDDEDHCIKSIQKYLVDDPRIFLVATVCDPQLAAGVIVEKKPDLLFLDIQMPGKSGFEILEILEKTNVKPCVIFVTAFENYTIQAIRASAFDYLLKPVDKTELSFAVERALNNIYNKKFERNYSAFFDHSAGKKLRFNTTGGFIMIDPSEIIYIQADWNYSEIHLKKDKFELVTINIGNIEKVLPSDDFIRINRSVIINLRYLKKVHRAKRLCTLMKDMDTFIFKIPPLRIRQLEEKL